MCTRLSLGLKYSEIRQVRGWEDDLQVGEWFDEQAFEPRDNIILGSKGVVIRRQDDLGASASPPATLGVDSTLVMQTMEWKLKAHWTERGGKTPHPAYARAEELIGNKTMWHKIKLTNRCIVLCEGSQVSASHNGIRYFKTKDGLHSYRRPKDKEKLLLLAGLWDCVEYEGDKEPTWTFVVVTTLTQAQARKPEDRQPVIISSKDAITTWLDTSSGKWSIALTAVLNSAKDNFDSLDKSPFSRDDRDGTQEPSAPNTLEAAFARQRARGTSTQTKPIRPPPSTAGKRKRVASPPPQDQSDNEILFLGTGTSGSTSQATKKKKTRIAISASASQTEDPV